jgi:hypothetical protein
LFHKKEEPMIVTATQNKSCASVFCVIFPRGFEKMKCYKPRHLVEIASPQKQNWRALEDETGNAYVILTPI